MSKPLAAPPRPLPSWLVLVASAVVAFHVFALVILALAAPSGPWPTPFGTSLALGPPFAGRINSVTTRAYLEPLRMTHNYHFTGTRLDLPAVKFEVRLKDDKGLPLETLEFPSPKANGWVRQRQELLAQELSDDEPVQGPRGEVIPAPGTKMETVRIWDMVPGENVLKLRPAPLHLIPKDRPVFRPRDWSLLLARSYVRYLCREHAAASGELVRFSRQPVMPAILFVEETPPGAFDTLASHFEEQRREN